MKSVKLTALLTTIVVSATMILPAFATESKVVEQTMPAPTEVSEFKELTASDMYQNFFGMGYLPLGGTRVGLVPIKTTPLLPIPADGKFDPYNTITRGELAVIISGIVDYKWEPPLWEGATVPPKLTMTCKDISKSDPNYAAYKECVEARIINPLEGNTFAPWKMLTQAEAVEILANMTHSYVFDNNEINKSKSQNLLLKLNNHPSSRSYAILTDFNIYRESEIPLAPDAYVSRIDIACMLENMFWRTLPQIEPWEYPTSGKYMAVNISDQTLYAIPGMTDTIKYTTKFNDIAGLKDYQKYALTRLVER